MFECHDSFHFSETSGQSSSRNVLDPVKRMNQERRQLNSQTKEIQKEKESTDKQSKEKLEPLARESQNKKRQDSRDDDFISTGKHSRDKIGEIEHNIESLEKLEKELQENLRKKECDVKVIRRHYNDSMWYISCFKGVYNHCKFKTDDLESKSNLYVKEISEKNLFHQGEKILQFSSKLHNEIQLLEQVKKVRKEFKKVYELQIRIQKSITKRKPVTSNDINSLLQTKTALKGVVKKAFSSQESEPLKELRNKLSEYLELLNLDYFDAVGKASASFSKLSKLRDEQKKAEKCFIKVQEERKDWIKDWEKKIAESEHAINKIKKAIDLVQQKLTVLKSEGKATTPAENSQQEIKVPTESLEDHLWRMFAQVDLSKIKSIPASEHKATKSSSTNENSTEFSDLDDIVDHGKESHANTNNKENGTNELMELLQVLRAHDRAKAHDRQDKASQVMQSSEANNREDEASPLIQLPHAQERAHAHDRQTSLMRTGEWLWDTILKMGGR